jgi:hypothetical protein
MNGGRMWLAILFAIVGVTLFGSVGPTLWAQPREKPVEVAPAGPVGKYKIHEVRLPNGEDHTVLLDTSTGRTWVLGLSRDGSRLAWFDMGPLPLDNKPPDKRQ